MRVGLIVYGGLDQRSGGYLYDRQLVAALRARGHSVAVFPLPRRAAYLHHLADNADAGLERAARRWRPALLLQDELCHPSLLGRNPRLRARLGCPLVAIVHHLRADEGWPARERAVYAALERRYLRTVDGLICNSRTTRARAAAIAGTRQPAVVAYPGGDRLGGPLSPEQIAARVRRSGPLRVLFVGNITRRKRLHVLLAGLARLPAASWQLTVVGSERVEPRYARGVRALATRLGCAGQVTWRGPLCDSALAACFGAADVLAVPSAYEGFGIVYLEGMAFGLPALATTAGAACEIVASGGNGWLVPPDDPAAIARCLAPLGGDRAALERLSLAARARYLAHPTWAASMARAVAFVERMAQGR